LSQIITVKIIQTRLAKIETKLTTMNERKDFLVKFILSSYFLTDWKRFNQMLHEYVNSLIILLKDAETPIVGEGLPLPQQKMYVPNPMNPNQPLAMSMGDQAATQLEGIHFTISQAIVILAVNVSVLIGTIYLKAPIVVPIVFGVGSVVAACSKQISDAIKGWLNRDKKKENPEDLRHWISKSIAEIRDDYTNRRFMIMQDRVTKDNNPNARPDEDEELYDLLKQSEETLAQDFISKIDWIDTECSDAGENCIRFLLNLLKAQPQVQSSPFMGHNQ
jgi:hypothetical protein